MIATIKSSFKSNLPNLEWMDDKTRKAAQEKADSVTEKIGYPDWIMDAAKLDAHYGGLAVDGNDYFGNALNSEVFHTWKNLEKAFKPVDKSSWEMTPPTVNAYYNPSNNEIVFPAGMV